jgi:6-pyruvoyltetrahydropterin/6-carboxytetrahydropterin synthase
MNTNRIVITKTFEFSASHRYWREDWSEEKNQQIFDLCTSPYGHGHNYELHVTVRGEVDPQTGMIINLSDLKKMVGQITDQFDHKFLNIDTPFFKDKLPTTENLALILFELINEKVTGRGNFELYKIRLYEKNDLYVDVWRDNS